MTSGIYKIENKTNGNFYIGSSVNIEGRWSRHIHELNQNRHHSRHLQNAWNKYGKDCFEFSIVEKCFVFELIFREQYYIDAFHPIYNNAPIAGSPLGVKHTDETRAKMSAAKKGVIFSQEHRMNLSIAGKGKHSDGVGRIFSPETRAKNSASLRAWWAKKKAGE